MGQDNGLRTSTRVRVLCVWKLYRAARGSGDNNVETPSLQTEHRHFNTVRACACLCVVLEAVGGTVHTLTHNQQHTRTVDTDRVASV
jgi:type VI protein secretion system component VasK